MAATQAVIHINLAHNINYMGLSDNIYLLRTDFIFLYVEWYFEYSFQMDRTQNTSIFFYDNIQLCDPPIAIVYLYSVRKMKLTDDSLYLYNTPGNKPHYANIFFSQGLVLLPNWLYKKQNVVNISYLFYTSSFFHWKRLS